MPSLIPSDMVVLMDASVRGNVTFLGSLPQENSPIDVAGLLTQAVTLDQPNADSLGIAAGPGAILGGSGAPLFATPTWFDMPSQALSLPLTIFGIMRGDGASDLFELSTNVAAAVGVRLNSDVGGVTVHGTAGIQTASAPANWMSDNKARRFCLRIVGLAPGDITLNVDGVPVPLVGGGVAAGQGAIPTVGTVGASHGGANPTTGAVGFLGYCNRIITPLEETFLLAYCSSSSPVSALPRWYFPPPGEPTSRNFIITGDSIPVGNSTVAVGVDAPQYAFVARAMSILGSRFKGGITGNVAIDGTRITLNDGAGFSALNQWIANGVPLIDPTMVNVGVIASGTNDLNFFAPSSILTASADALTMLGMMQTCAGQFVTDLTGIPNGPHYVIPQSIPGTSSARFNTHLQYRANTLWRQGNNLSRLSTPNARVVLNDIGSGADPLLGSLIDPGFIPEPSYDTLSPIHPAKPGHEHWAGLLVRLLLSLGL